jgi:hypothetical protein
MALRIKQAVRTPETFCEAYLLAKYFDGTVAETFERSPNGIGVHEAYNLAVEGLFGAKALKRYMASGGLRNRAWFSSRRPR